MTHEEVLDLLPAYLDGDLPDAGEIDVHLTSCADCSAALASYRVMLAELSVLPDGDPAPPVGLAARAIAQIPEPPASARIRNLARQHPVAVAAGIGGAAIAAFAAAYAIKRSRRAPNAIASAST